MASSSATATTTVRADNAVAADLLRVASIDCQCGVFFKVPTMRQSSRRSLTLGRDRPVPSVDCAKLDQRHFLFRQLL